MGASIHIICGPTASGKSAIALELAQKNGGVIINADSQQLYRDLPILTARPTPDDEARAAHKLYGILSADETPSAGKWLRLAKMEIDWALSQEKLPIVVGGTGLYLKALMQGIAEIPDIDPAVVAQAENDYAAMGKEAFEERLRHVDPQFFERLTVYDKQRLVRAYSVWLGTGKSLSYWQRLPHTPPYASEMFIVTKVELPREELYRRCDARFVKMVEQGAVEEVRSLPHRGRVREGASTEDGANNAPLPASPLRGEGIYKIIGVREILLYLQGETSLEEAIASAQQATRNYAKRQMTWFRNQIEKYT